MSPQAKKQRTSAPPPTFYKSCAKRKPNASRYDGLLKTHYKVICQCVDGNDPSVRTTHSVFYARDEEAEAARDRFHQAPKTADAQMAAIARLPTDTRVGDAVDDGEEPIAVPAAPPALRIYVRNGIRCRVESQYECNDDLTPRYVYATGLGRHYKQCSQQTVHETDLRTRHQRTVVQIATAGGPSGWEWVNLEMLVSRFDYSRFANREATHAVLKLPPIKAIEAMGGAADRVKALDMYLLGSRDPRSLYDHVSSHPTFLARYSLKQMLVLMVQGKSAGSYDQEDGRGTDPHESSVTCGPLRSSLSQAAANLGKNKVPYVQTMGMAFDETKLLALLRHLNALFVHGGRDKKTLIKHGIVSDDSETLGEDDVHDSLSILRYSYHQNMSGAQQQWQQQFSFSNMVITPVLLQRKYVHGPLDSTDQFEWLQLVAPVLYAHYDRMGELARLRQEVKDNNGELPPPLTREAWTRAQRAAHRGSSSR